MFNKAAAGIEGKNISEQGDLIFVLKNTLQVINNLKVITFNLRQSWSLLPPIRLFSSAFWGLFLFLPPSHTGLCALIFQLDAS